jgi:dTDP-glucose pyrophosphorylase
MLNILVPVSNESRFFAESEYLYPKTLAEIDGRMMIEIVIESLQRIPDKKRFIFVIRKQDIERFHFENILRLLTKVDCEIVKVDGQTQGAACSCLMAIDHIDSDEPLLIANCDQLLDSDLGSLLSTLGTGEADAGAICFESVHPKWSYVKVGEDGFVQEAAEKRPISRDALAGLYFFKRGRDFVAGAMRMIEKEASIEGNFFIAPVFNELILAGKRVAVARIPSSEYHSFYSPQKIKEYEAVLVTQRGSR